MFRSVIVVVASYYGKRVVEVFLKIETMKFACPSPFSLFIFSLFLFACAGMYRKICHLNEDFNFLFYKQVIKYAATFVPWHSSFPFSALLLWNTPTKFDISFCNENYTGLLFLEMFAYIGPTYWLDFKSQVRNYKFVLVQVCT